MPFVSTVFGYPFEPPSLDEPKSLYQSSSGANKILPGLILSSRLLLVHEPLVSGLQILFGIEHGSGATLGQRNQRTAHG
jgi:hypothetical protein